MQNFWRDKNILITGASGFIGTHLTTRLAKHGANVFKLNKNVSDEKFINTIFKKNSFNYCFHLAAQSIVDIGSVNPISTFNTNIRGTWNILESARIYGLNGLIIASTSHVYGKNKLPFLEEYFPKPSRPYETSKACADILAQTYASYYSLPVAIARCVNIYGPGDHNIRIVPETIKHILKGVKPEIFSDQTTRDYMFIDDAIEAYILLAENLKRLKKRDDNIIFNFGTGRHYSNKTIVKTLINLSDKTIQPIQVKKGRKQEISKQYVSIKKAKKLLGWEPKYSLIAGLKKTLAWYQSQKKYNS